MHINKTAEMPRIFSWLTTFERRNPRSSCLGQMKTVQFTHRTQHWSGQALKRMIVGSWNLMHDLSQIPVLMRRIGLWRVGPRKSMGRSNHRLSNARLQEIESRRSHDVARHVPLPLLPLSGVECLSMAATFFCCLAATIYLLSFPQLLHFILYNFIAKNRYSLSFPASW